jgi:hypothetical protein
MDVASHCALDTNPTGLSLNVSSRALLSDPLCQRYGSLYSTFPKFETLEKFLISKSLHVKQCAGLYLKAGLGGKCYFSSMECFSTLIFMIQRLLDYATGSKEIKPSKNQV